jgi:hypothetical protein
MRAIALAGSLSLFAAGCSCSQDYGFTSDFGEVPAVAGDDVPDQIGPYTAMDVSPEGQRLTMAYYDRGDSGVGYAVGTIDAEGAVTWIHERVDGYTEGKRGKYVSQKTARDGTVWVAYHDEDEKTLRARKRLGGGLWDEAVVVGDGGVWSEMAMIGSSPMVAHANDVTGALQWSTLSDGAWQTESVYTSAATPGLLPDGTATTFPAQVGQPRILVQNDTVYVAFHDVAKGELHLLTGGPGGDFKDEVVDSGGVGAWPSLVVHNGQIHIAYQDVQQQRLMLAVQDGDRWQIEAVDTGPMRGADTELYVADDKLHILYFDGWDANLMLATEGGSDWSLELVAGEGTAAGFHNATQVVGGFRYVATYDYTNNAHVMLTLP